jgi:hypothetical protein
MHAFGTLNRRQLSSKSVTVGFSLHKKGRDDILVDLETWATVPEQLEALCFKEEEF